MFRFLALAGVAQGMEWESYKQQFGKVYNGVEEDAKRAQFETNSQSIADNNAAGGSLTMGFNQFTDLTQAEYRVAAGLGYKPSAARHAGLPHLGVHMHTGEELAASVDWSTKGAVTPVKDQGQCGSCWSFSSTGGMEGAWQIASGSLVSMSEQQLVDCSTENGGCQGGDMGLAFDFAKTVNVATEASYPYKGVDGTCQSSFATTLDHGVLAVGYGDGFFKVKNSWGSSWGESGYLKISSEGNTCGIHSDATQPVVSASVAAEETKQVEITLPWLTGGCSNRGKCGLAYQGCCLGFQADGFPCGCKLSDGGSGVSKGDCGDCGAAYTLCCAGFAADGFACTCDVADGGVVV